VIIIIIVVIITIIIIVIIVAPLLDGVFLLRARARSSERFRNLKRAQHFLSFRAQ